jgi:four helix bundle protein
MPDAGYWMNYRNLEVWRLARELVIAIYYMTLTKLPKFERFEGGRQIRRSIKSVKSNIVEGYGRRRYKQEFVRFVDYHSLRVMKLQITWIRSLPRTH